MIIWRFIHFSLYFNYNITYLPDYFANLSTMLPNYVINTTYRKKPIYFRKLNLLRTNLPLPVYWANPWIIFYEQIYCHLLLQKKRRKLNVNPKFNLEKYL